MLHSIKHSIAKRYGSLRGALRYFHYQLLLQCGFYRRYSRIDFRRVRRLVFICSGNICRSPLGECVANSLGFPSVSYGLHCRGGDPADSRALAYARSVGLDMDGHRTQNIKSYRPAEGDLLVGMEPAHLRELEEILGRDRAMTSVMLWGRPTSIYLHDPYCCCIQYFNFCEAKLFKAVEVIIRHASQR